jgi:GNAT superfamily N-acetyltransferase
MARHAVAERVALAAAATWRGRNRHLDGHLVDERDGLVISLSGLPAPAFSGAAIEREPEDAPAALGWAEQIFRSRGASLGVVVERGRHPTVERALAAMDLGVISTELAMAVETRRVSPPLPIDGLEVRRATSVEDLDAMATLEVDAFGTDAETAGGFFSTGILEQPAVSLYVARFDGVAVSMTYTQTHGGSLGVFGVATARSARGRGYATAITATAILEGRRDGADLAWLQASRIGVPVYQRMGFEVVSTWEVWVRSARPARAGAGTTS